MNTIRHDAEGPITWLTLNRPDKRNALGPETVQALIAALERCRDDAGCRVVVITGAGKVFSAGGDLSTMAGVTAPLADEEPATSPRTSRVASRAPTVPVGWGKMLAMMHDMGKPVIAMVNGHAIAGGFGLALACDLVIASENAKFAIPEIKVGMWPMIITAEIIRNVGRKKAVELMLTGRRMTATEAERAGLINRVVPAAELRDEVARLANELAAQSPAITALGLASFYAAGDLPYREAIDFLEAQLAKLMALPDSREGLRAFVEKRPPKWGGG